MGLLQFRFHSSAAATTEALAIAIAGKLEMRDCILLSGPVGAGKSLFARAAIRELCGKNEEVPSPSFTLVQTYTCKGLAIWHIDLYRLQSKEAAFELGLEDAFEHGISLIEWPEILAGSLPPRHLSIALIPDPTNEESRTIEIFAHGDWPWLPTVLGAGLA